MSNLDFNDAAPQRDGFDLIPNGTIVRVVSNIRAGGQSRAGMETADAGWLTASKTTDSLYLNFEFTVSDGPYRNRKIWQNMTVSGGEVDEAGNSKAWNITKSTMRAMLNSARNVKPDDESAGALAARRINNWGDVSGVEFLAKISIRKAKKDSGYSDQNQIGTVVEPGSKEYLAPGLPAGPAVAARPAAAVAAPSWAGTPAATQGAPTGAVVPAWAR